MFACIRGYDSTSVGMRYEQTGAGAIRVSTENEVTFDTSKYDGWALWLGRAWGLSLRSKSENGNKHRTDHARKLRNKWRYENIMKLNTRYNTQRVRNYATTARETRGTSVCLPGVYDSFVLLEAPDGREMEECGIISLSSCGWMHTRWERQEEEEEEDEEEEEEAAQPS